MINVGRQLKAGFRSVLQEQGQEVVIISNWKTPFQVINRVKGVKSNKEGRPDYSVFQFTEAYSIENGSVIYVPKSDTYWRVYETEDRILGNVYVLFEAKTNKTWLEMDEKEFEDLILGAKAPEGASMDGPGASAAPAAPPRPAPVLNFTPPKPVAPIKLKTEEEKWAAKVPPPAPELQTGSNPNPDSSAAMSPESESIQQDDQVNPEASSNAASDSEVTSAGSPEPVDSQPAGETDVPKPIEAKPRQPFRKRSDQLYVSRQIRNLISAIPKAELDERLKSETISALKAIEGLLVSEVTEREKSQAEKRLEIVIGALDLDLEFAVNVAAYLPPIFTYFGLEIN